ncbi:uncharacterized protein LOC116351547, partial [Contarinia nasturtii]|uniref:uncharacterized protein LOC116351547 n=1 Tax=Contarinia nasturtii TaxID=265458 RepID=UPI0012D39203
MNFLHVLALALIFFEGFIIHCEGTNNPVTINPDLPDHIIEDILYEGGIKAVELAVQNHVSPGAVKNAMSRLFRDCIIAIMPDEVNETSEYYKNGERCIQTGNRAKLISLFEHFGENARRIHIYYCGMSDVMRRDINENIIKRYAHQLTEFRINTFEDSNIWDEISNDRGELRFAQVKRFKYTGPITKATFDLNSIFPKLESLSFFVRLTNANCLANVRNLKDIRLFTGSIEEHQLAHIFKNNKQLSKVSLALNLHTTETLRAVENHLNRLQIFKIKYVNSEFFRRIDRIYNLTSVTTFDVKFNETNDLIGDLSFDMPNLKKLVLRGNIIDHRIADFINHFEQLDSVEVDSRCRYDIVKCVKELNKVKEFRTNGFENSPSFKKSFSQMNNVNKYFKKKMPAWTFSQGTTEDFAIFK